ncbi:exodeoxyribonuclease VII large subunit [Oscillospiraceae bacterium MB08-C2-2]|nr:exodeoxyribonuclease VII large subunit [Oscillospiraceae bacterium MB08-C2-2]
MNILTVSQLNRYLKFLLDGDKKLSDLYIRGEISNYIHHVGSGHMYFTLKDSTGAIKAVMFRSYGQELPFSPKNGMGVLVRANIGFYERDGNIQLYVTDMQPDGVGTLYLAFQQLKDQLEKEGYFDSAHKRPIPRYPRKIGVVTSENGAALRDILQILERRYPLGQVVLVPAAVQGEGASAQIVQALDFLSEGNHCDVIIVARGGGSLEDLWAFNQIEVARAIYRCQIPVLSAVGHETDYTICDFVADLRAPTPSAAAELVAEDVSQIAEHIREMSADMAETLSRRLSERANRLDSLARTAKERIESRLAHSRTRLDALRQNRLLASPMGYVEKNKEKLDFFEKTLYNNSCIFMQHSTRELAAAAALLDSLSPLRVLGRGYALILKDNAGVTDLSELSPGDRVSLRLRDGVADASITHIRKEKPRL